MPRFRFTVPTPTRLRVCSVACLAAALIYACGIIDSLAQNKPAPDSALWSFKPIRRPAVPESRHGGLAANPIDSFLLARLEKAGLRPSLLADRRSLLRRVTMDLTGIP